MARSAKPTKPLPRPPSNRERPPEPKRYKASKDELLDFYKQMLLIRRFEERAGQLYGLGLIGGFCHLYIGQEAVAVGLQSAMTVGKDSVITGYRDHGHMLAYGIDPKVIMAELTGRAAGISKGKGGSMHMFSVEHGFYGGHGIVGAQVSLGTGLAFKHQYSGDGGVCLAYFGDGAANQGQVYESFNMAELWKLPVIYAIENNQYAMGTQRRALGVRGPVLQARRKLPHSGHPGRRDGRARGARRGRGQRSNGSASGKGPIIIELKTYRYRGHSMSDPAKYRTREEVQAYREGKRPDRPCRARPAKLGVERGRAEGDRQGDQGHRRRSRQICRRRARARRGRALHRRAGGELLMAIELKMPALSPTMEEGTLAKWLVKEGDAVKSGDILAEIETDKATMEFEAVDEGTIAKILVPEGTDGVKVGTVDRDDGRGRRELRPLRPPAEGRAEARQSRAKPNPTPPSAAPEPRNRRSRLVATADGRGDPEVPAGTAMARPRVREALRDAMAEEMRRDERVFVIGEEVAEYQGAYKVTQGLLEEFGPKRVIDTPITEYGFAGVGTGAAMGGLRPVDRVHDLQFRDAGDRPHHQFGGQDQLHVGRPDALPDRVPRPQRRRQPGRRPAQPELRALVRQRARPDRDRALFSAADAKGLLKAAIRSEDPVVFLENELLYGQSFDVPELDDYVLPIGKARIVRAGKDVTIVSYSIGVGVALEAAETLAGEGIEAEVIDLRTLRPLDKATVLESLAKTNRMVVVEEGWPACSIASEIIAIA